jgi:pSer/pThr/pTyr-binding forkhead associated (FHA) protein
MSHTAVSNASAPFLLRIHASVDANRRGTDVRVDGPLTIGRDPSCSLAIADPAVSRQHASIEAAPDGVRVVDLGSGNGVWVNNERVKDVVVLPGQQFKIGSTLFECVAAGVPVAAAAGVAADATMVLPRVAMPVPATAHVPPASPVGFVLTVVGPGEKTPVGTTFTIRQDSARVGRSPECEIVLEERDISRAHARIEATPAGYQITDLGSTSGIWIERRQLKNGLVQTGQAFRIGGRVMVQLAPVDLPAEAMPPVNESSVASGLSRKSADGIAEPEDANATRVARVPEAIRQVPPEDFRLKPEATRGQEKPEAESRKPKAEPAADANATRMISTEDLAKSVAEPNPDATRVIPAAALAQAAAGDFSGTVVMKVSAEMLAAARRVEDEGELLEVSAHKPFLLDDPERLWYVVTGGLLIFTVAIEKGQPAGARNHFLGIDEGQACFGFDLAKYAAGSGFLVVAKQGTTVRKIAVGRLRELGAMPAQAKTVASIVDTWVTGLSRTLIRDFPTKRSGETDDETSRHRDRRGALGGYLERQPHVRRHGGAGLHPQTHTLPCHH